MSPPSDQEWLAARQGHALYSDFLAVQAEFEAVTRRARHHFATRDWAAHRGDARRRLQIYRRTVNRAVKRIKLALGEKSSSVSLWSSIRVVYDGLVTRQPNAELCRTFFNSVTRKVFSTRGVRPDVEYLSLRSSLEEGARGNQVVQRLESVDDAQSLAENLLGGIDLGVEWADRSRDAWRLAGRLEGWLASEGGSWTLKSVERIRPIFYRQTLAFCVAAIRSGRRVAPLVLAFRNGDRGVQLDAVLFDENHVSILFSFTRSYFFVDTNHPKAIVRFIKELLPKKPVSEIYISLGFVRHGKTELYAELQRFLKRSDQPFIRAAGDAGMVMAVFTLDGHDVVFKIIRDQFAFPKRSTAADVHASYQFVFENDRVGRLVDAQSFEYLAFCKDRFEASLFEELTTGSARRVSVDADQVVISQLYLERKLTPLNLYLRQASRAAAHAATIEYGKAIKELAMANIFPGDFLLKNFGVTRHGRVVFYDYDEICKLTDCRFRYLPPPRYEGQEMESEPWFTVAERDVFPEEFSKFLGLSPELRASFMEHHANLLQVETWRRWQELLRSGDVFDPRPYPDTLCFS